MVPKKFVDKENDDVEDSGALALTVAPQPTPPQLASVFDKIRVNSTTSGWTIWTVWGSPEVHDIFKVPANETWDRKSLCEMVADTITWASGGQNICLDPSMFYVIQLLNGEKVNNDGEPSHLYEISLMDFELLTFGLDTTWFLELDSDQHEFLKPVLVANEQFMISGGVLDIQARTLHLRFRLDACYQHPTILHFIRTDKGEPKKLTKPYGVKVNSNDYAGIYYVGYPRLTCLVVFLREDEENGDRDHRWLKVFPDFEPAPNRTVSERETESSSDEEIIIGYDPSKDRHRRHRCMTRKSKRKALRDRPILPTNPDCITISSPSKSVALPLPARTISGASSESYKTAQSSQDWLKPDDTMDIVLGAMSSQIQWNGNQGMGSNFTAPSTPTAEVSDVSEYEYDSCSIICLDDWDSNASSLGSEFESDN